MNSSALIGGKFKKRNPLQDFLSSVNAIISANESTEFIKGHVIYNPAYTYKFQLKTTIAASEAFCMPDAQFFLKQVFYAKG